MQLARREKEVAELRAELKEARDMVRSLEANVSITMHHNKLLDRCLSSCGHGDVSDCNSTDPALAWLCFVVVVI